MRLWIQQASVPPDSNYATVQYSYEYWYDRMDIMSSLLLLPFNCWSGRGLEQLLSESYE